MIDKSILDDSKYDFLRTDPRLGDNIILLGLGGSHAYGTNIPTSDIDLRGVAIRSAYDICTNHNWEETVNTETDTTIYTIDKMFKLLAECNPNCIEILGLRQSDYLINSVTGEILLANKDLFLSKHCIKTFGGYATQQLYRLQQKTLVAMTKEEYNNHIAKVIASMEDHLHKNYGLNNIKVVVDPLTKDLVVNIDKAEQVPINKLSDILGEINNVYKDYTKASKRNDHAIAHDKINKHAMHLIRLYMMVLDILNDGEIITYRDGSDHTLLMDIRNGKFTGEDGLMNKDFFDILHEYEEKFDKAKSTTKLPDHPDYETINALLTFINRGIVIDDYYCTGDYCIGDKDVTEIFELHN